MKNKGTINAERRGKMINVGQRITMLRQAKGITTNKLANLSGISQSFLRDVELGNKNVTVEFLSYICDSLEISLCDFFREDLPELFDDELSQTIYALNSNQKKALLQFIKSMQNEKARTK